MRPRFDCVLAGAVQLGVRFLLAVAGGYPRDRMVWQRYGTRGTPGPSDPPLRDWRELVRRAGSAVAVAVEFPELNDEAVAQIAGVRAAALRVPILLVTRFTEANPVRLPHTSVEALVWIKSGPEAVHMALADLLKRSPIPQLTAAVQSSGVLSSALKRKLLVALEADPPFRTVKRWARATGCGRRALDRSWRNQVGTAHKPAEFLKAILAVRGEDGRPAGDEHRQMIRWLSGTLSSCSGQDSSNRAPSAGKF